jgi:4-hydroxybenzoyl-CoA thioesterase
MASNTSFTSTHRVRFGDVDRAGIAYYPRYFHWYHVAFEEWFEREIGVPYRVLIEERRLGFPTVRIVAEYRSPLRFGDDAVIEVSVRRVGRTSVVFRYRARNATTGREAAEATITVVCVNMDTFRPARIPAALRKAFLRKPAAR